VRNSRNSAVIGGILVALVVIIYLLVSPARTEIPAARLGQPPATQAPPPTAQAQSATPSPTPSPTPSTLYGDQTWKFSVALPAPYRHSARLSIASTGAQRPAAQEVFTARTESDEAAVALQTDETASPVWNYVAVVHVFTGTGNQTPRDFYNAFSFSRDQILEDVVVDGHQALKVTSAASYPVEYLIKDGDRMFMLGYSIYQSFDVPTGATKEKLDAILASFKFAP